MNNNKRSFDAFVALGGIIAVIALMLNPILTGWFLIKVVELMIIMAVVNFGTRALTGKSLRDLIRSFRTDDNE